MNLNIWKSKGESGSHSELYVDERILKVIQDEFSHLLYAACVYINPRHLTTNVGFLIFNLFVNCSYIYLLLITTLRQSDNFVIASQSIHMLLLDIIAVTMLVSFNLNRRRLNEFLKAIQNDFYNYADNLDMTEMQETISRLKTQKLIILITIPTYLLLTASCCLLGRTMDEYLGYATNETYVNGVYMLTPIPMWYPVEIKSQFLHAFVVLSQVTGANVLALSISGGDAVLLVFCQALTVQLKKLTLRLRKIDKWAYLLHINSGGKKLSKKDMFNDPNYMKHYNICLRKAAEHHCVIIENFDRLYIICKWPSGSGMLAGSFIIAMSMLVFALGGGKPSIISLACFLLVAEVLNLAMICSQSEDIKELGESLHEELYSLNWMDADLPAKKSIMIMIERSKRPLILTAGGLQELNWSTFSGLMNTAYSYLNLLIAAKG